MGEVVDVDVRQTGAVRGHAVQKMPGSVLRRDSLHGATVEVAAVDVAVHGGQVDVVPVRVEHMVVVQLRQPVEVDDGQPPVGRR